MKLRCGGGSVGQRPQETRERNNIQPLCVNVREIYSFQYLLHLARRVHQMTQVRQRLYEVARSGGFTLKDASSPLNELFFITTLIRAPLQTA